MCCEGFVLWGVSVCYTSSRLFCILQSDFFFLLGVFFFLICMRSLYVIYRNGVEVHCQVFYCFVFYFFKPVFYLLNERVMFLCSIM